jgi:hypothetical protein
MMNISKDEKHDMFDKLSDNVIACEIFKYFSFNDVCSKIIHISKRFQNYSDKMIHECILIHNENIHLFLSRRERIFKTKSLSLRNDIKRYISLDKILENVCVLKELILDTSSVHIKTPIPKSITKLCTGSMMFYGNQDMVNTMSDKISHLSIRTYPKYVEHIVEIFKSYPNLESLDLGIGYTFRNQKLPEIFFDRLLKQTSLKKLSLVCFDLNSDYSDKTLALEELMLERCVVNCKNIMPFLTQSLKLMSLRYVDISDNILKILSEHTKCKKINITRLDFSAYDMDLKNDVKYLNDLNLSHLFLSTNSFDCSYLYDLNIPTLSILELRFDGCFIFAGSCVCSFDLGQCDNNYFNNDSNNDYFKNCHCETCHNKGKENIKLKINNSLSKSLTTLCLYDVNCIADNILEEISTKCKSLKELYLLNTNICKLDVLKYLSGMKLEKLMITTTYTNVTSHKGVHLFANEIIWLVKNNVISGYGSLVYHCDIDKYKYCWN